LKSQILLAALLMTGLAYAGDKDHSYDHGRILEMNAVECGFDQKASKGLTGELLGTDSQHTKTRQMLCPEYTIKADRVSYRVRPKEEKHPALLPVGETANFRMKKEIMVLRVPEGDDKERDYVVVAITANAEAPNPRAANNPPKSNVK